MTHSHVGHWGSSMKVGVSPNVSVNSRLVDNAARGVHAYGA